jgi:hypothetical protein
MEQSTITGDKRIGLFEQIKKKKTLVNMHVKGIGGYDRLTLIIGIRTLKKKPYFLIDPPNDFREAVKGMTQWKINFQLTGPDALEYRFSTSHGELSGKDILIEFPDSIERIQRRKHFRLDSVPKTTLVFDIEEHSCQMEVVNISMSGLLAAMPRQKKKGPANPVLKIRQTIWNATLACPVGKELIGADILELFVVREDKAGRTGGVRYAFHFTKMAAKDKIHLTDIIYKLQRFFLQKR